MPDDRAVVGALLRTAALGALVAATVIFRGDPTRTADLECPVGRVCFDEPVGHTPDDPTEDRRNASLRHYPGRHLEER